VCRYAGEGHLTKEWKETTRDIPDVSTAAPRAATYVNKLKVNKVFICGSLNGHIVPVTNKNFVLLID
jgi:hypothetical protein